MLAYAATTALLAAVPHPAVLAYASSATLLLPLLLYLLIRLMRLVVSLIITDFLQRPLLHRTR
jgi:hypothetical protein